MTSGLNGEAASCGGLRSKGVLRTSSRESPLVSIVTVVYNGGRFLEEAISSVVNQTYKNIEYVIIDGGSTDNSVDIIRKYEDSIDLWISEPDQGMYDALGKGFARISGDICAYLNADDYYSPSACEIIVDIFRRNKRVDWATGMTVFYNERSQMVSAMLPFRYKKNLIVAGMYGWKNLCYIQQESTFWRATLNSHVDWEKFKGFKFAGDFYLWKRFAENGAELSVIGAWIGGFRIHAAQKSKAIGEYKEEIRAIATKRNFMTHLSALLEWILIWLLPVRARRLLNRNIFLYNYSVKEFI